MKMVMTVFALVVVFIMGCGTEFGHLNLKTSTGIGIYIDDEYQGDAGDGITKLKISEGNHIVKVLGYSKDGDWLYQSEKQIYVGTNMELQITLIPDRFATEQKKEKLRTVKMRSDKINNEPSEVSEFNNIKFDYKESSGYYYFYSSTEANIRITSKKTLNSFLKKNMSRVQVSMEKSLYNLVVYYKRDKTNKKNAIYNIRKTIISLASTELDYSKEEIEQMICDIDFSYEPKRFYKKEKIKY